MSFEYPSLHSRPTFYFDSKYPFINLNHRLVAFCVSHAIKSNNGGRSFTGRAGLRQLVSQQLLLTPGYFDHNGEMYCEAQVLDALSCLLSQKGGLAFKLHQEVRKDGPIELSSYENYWMTSGQNGEHVVNTPEMAPEPATPIGSATGILSPTSATEILSPTSAAGILSPISAPTTPQLPHPLQYVVVPALQTILEICLYQYIKENLPHILRQQRWTFPQSAKINAYLGQEEVKRYIELNLSEEEPVSTRKTLDDLLWISKIAEDRKPLSDADMTECMQTAIKATKLFKDLESEGKIIKLSAKIDSYEVMIEKGRAQSNKLINDQKQAIEAKKKELASLMQAKMLEIKNEENTLAEIEQDCEEAEIEWVWWAQCSVDELCLYRYQHKPLDSTSKYSDGVKAEKVQSEGIWYAE
jgi:hypothetical protein